MLNHFGETYSAETCGNCDNCMVSKRECDVSRESYLLMTSIQACGGYWGLNMPIDVLRGSRSKKVVDAQFDKLLLHGLGKDHSSNWWKKLAYQLISYGYLTETIKDVYRTVSVSQQGKQYLGSARPDHQPPLLLPFNGEMVDAEEHETVSSNVGDLKSLATLENEGFSEADLQLYHMLLEERKKIARVTGTAPYALCGDQTVKKIALARPSTKARLANIDGVNQHLVIAHGDHLLQTIRHLSQKLNLSLDGKAGEHTAFTRKQHLVVNTCTKLTPAKYEAWKMWHEDGLSIQKIANYPGRSAAPIKEQTVLEYLLEAVSKGFDINWARLCDEVGLTDEIFSAIQDAISKVGSKDKLKPIKNELPDDITYAHIKVCLVMENCGIVPEVIPPSQKKGNTDEVPSKESETCSVDTCHAEEPHELEEFVKNMVTYGCTYNYKEMTSLPVTKEEVQELSVGCDDDELCSHKRQKVDCPDGSFTVLAVTESSVLNLLQKHDEGLPLSDILEHFNGSKSEAVIDLLSCLESDFMIFKKNNLYWLM